MAERRAARHDLVWLEPGSARAARALPLPPLSTDDALSRLADWIDAGRPLVVARQPADLPPGRLRLGLPLPASQGKLRLAFDVPRAAVLRSAPPPPLAALADHLPRRWRGTLEALLACPAIRAADPRAFGSAGMQAVTGEDCVGDDSDLDLLLAPASREAALAALATLSRIDGAGLGPRLDGEIVDARGRATSWRELAGGASDILIKQFDAVAMTGHAEFLDGLGGAAA
jgi:phosphoribosyl-dephospho-CoA transferase